MHFFSVHPSVCPSVCLRSNRLSSRTICRVICKKPFHKIRQRTVTPTNTLEALKKLLKWCGCHIKHWLTYLEGVHYTQVKSRWKKGVDTQIRSLLGWSHDHGPMGGSNPEGAANKGGKMLLICVSTPGVFVNSYSIQFKCLPGGQLWFGEPNFGSAGGVEPNFGSFLR